MNLAGNITALVTPFKDGVIDEERFREFIEWQIREGVNGLSPCGTTGESATLSHAEHEKVIGICIDQVKGRVPVLAGAGSNNTSEAIALGAFAKKAGADALLLITPYYNKPTQEGLVAHYKAIAREVSLPTIVYNVPGRTALNIQPATMARLFREVPEIIGVKEATGDLAQVSDILELCGEGFILLSGDDFTVAPSMALGGKGVISVVANLVPAKMSSLCSEAAAGNAAETRKLHFELAPLCRACFLETNPVPVKTALGLMGKMSGEVRLPLVPLQAANQRRLEEVLREADLIA
ncbi:MAG: 4-hydroxy-tetrahydrodipicolinate synthase [Desulfovibrio sp.]|jgi:4-hydroxy-tetrahydrodipicolinate synthase|nr:4-hydroxy-tetrahydrodipicolinate synthase [Desulfovibrio sp.]